MPDQDQRRRALLARQRDRTSSAPSTNGSPYLKLGVYTDVVQRGEETVFLKQLTIPEAARGEQFVRLKDRIQRQINVGERLDHPHHARLLDHERVNTHTYNLFYTLAPGEELESLVRDERLTTDDILTVTEQLAQALAYGHNLRPSIVHGDTTPRNVHYDKASQHATLYDHSASRVEQMTDDGFVQLSTADIGTFGYTAPEVLDGKRPEPASDVNGLGSLMKFMLTGRNPERVSQQLLQRQARDDSLVELIDMMTVENPSQRPTAEEVVGYVGRIREGKGLVQTSSYIKKGRELLSRGQEKILRALKGRGLTESDKGFYTVVLMVGSLVGGLALFSYLSEGSIVDETNKLTSPTTEQAPITEVVTPLQEWQQFEREQRTVLLQSVLSETGEGAFMTLLSEMPQTLSYLNRWTLGRDTVGPHDYLFRVNPVTKPNIHGVVLSPGAHDAFDLYLSMFPAGDTAIGEYRSAIQDKAWDLGIHNDPLVEQFSDVEFTPFYETVRNPSEQDLRLIYNALDSVPRFMTSAFVATMQDDVQIATAMIEADPTLYEGHWGSASLRPQTTWNGESTPITVSRYDNGELRFPDKTAEGAHFIRHGQVLPKHWEKQPDAVKFLFRRGPEFIDGYQQLIHAYSMARTEEEFVKVGIGEVTVHELLPMEFTLEN